MTKQEKKRAGGRPSAFKQEYIELAYNYCLLGSTDSQLAEFFNVAESTLNLWKKKFPEFADSLKRGKTVADAKVAGSLFSRATGYSCPEAKVNVVDGEVVITDVVKHYPPDATSIIFWLKNRQPDKWRDKQEVENTFEVDKDLMERLKTEYVDRMALARERQRKVLVERGLLGEDEPY